MSVGAFQLPPGGRVRAVGTLGPEGLLVAVGIEPQPWRPRAVVEATIARVGRAGVVQLLGGAVRVLGDARVSGPEGELLTRRAIGAGTRAWLGGHWSEAMGFIADEVRLRRPLEFEIVKVAGPTSGYDPARGRVEIAGFTVVMNGRTMLGTGEDAEDDA